MAYGTSIAGRTAPAGEILRHIRKLLKAYGMIASMSGKANCWDNAAAESFFKTLKVERVYRQTYAIRDHARTESSIG